MMLVVQGEVIVEEGSIDRVRDALQTMVEETNKEAGCLAYSFSVDVCDPTIMRIAERWESMDALKEHMASEHMAAFGVAVAEIKPKGMDIKVFEIAQEVSLPG